MSFNISFALTRHDDPQAKVDDAYAAQARPHQHGQGTGEEADRVMATAGSVLRDLAAALGEHWIQAQVMVHGHVNPGNAARSGWSNDGVSVIVTVTHYAGD